ncbi:MAG: DUF2752 domain-containing protein [Alphaproteobacteria bacterium]|nr:DUF2752 domain-containing protein [Alphaproteobacteria bacterium]MCB9696322.1 DUF2752 domain-containing protein [Alphaproteobacteria bacterium]
MIDAALDRAASWLARPAVTRIGSLGLAVGISCVFVAAALVEPDPSGHGTHLRLGLGNCSFLTMTGWPCPMCGATTTFALMAHLRPLEALINQPFAFLLFLMSAFGLGVSVAEVVDPRGRWTRIVRVLEPRETLWAILFLVFMGLAWGYKAWLMFG